MLGMQIVDLEPMVAKFGHPSVYLRDNIHPHMFINIEIFNIYLNILRDHERLDKSVARDCKGFQTKVHIQTSGHD